MLAMCIMSLRLKQGLHMPCFNRHKLASFDKCALVHEHLVHSILCTSRSCSINNKKNPSNLQDRLLIPRPDSDRVQIQSSTTISTPSATIVFVHSQELSAARNALPVLTASPLQVQQEERAEQQRLAQQEREQSLQQQRITQQAREQQAQQRMIMEAGPAMRANVVQTAR